MAFHPSQAFLVALLFVALVPCRGEAEIRSKPKYEGLRQRLVAAFREADKDGDSKLSQSEFVTVVGSTHSFTLDTAEAKHDTLDSFARSQESMMEFWAAFLNSIAMIIVTELGDKTFFIAAIMAMRHSRLPVFIGAVGALAVMTVLSSLIGFALPNILPRKYTHYASTILFFFFGYKLLREAWEMEELPVGANKKNDELEEAEAELEKLRGDVESGGVAHRGKIKILVQAFTLTFLAEWGDRSQIATIALASAKDPFGVTLGGSLGHAMCTGLAVVGGRLLADRISERTVALSGGILFLLFAVHALWAGP